MEFFVTCNTPYACWSSTSTSTFYDNPSMVMITCRAQRSANRQKIYKKSADHINSDKIKLYTKFILESVQRRAARYVTKRYHNTSSVTSMLNDLNWNTLENRRNINRVMSVLINFLLQNTNLVSVLSKICPNFAGHV
jgi:hypothetical protein